MISEANFAAMEIETEDGELELRKPTFRTSAFKTHRKPVENLVRVTANSDGLSVEHGERIFSSALVSCKLKSVGGAELEQKLVQLMKSPAIRAVLHAAQSYAFEHNLSEEAAMLAIISALKDLDSVWDQILLKEGLKSLSGKA